MLLREFKRIIGRCNILVRLNMWMFFRFKGIFLGGINRGSYLLIMFFYLVVLMKLWNRV